jgi:hypothetical protein
MAKHNGNDFDPRHATETPDVSHIKNPDVTHEASDVSVSGVLKFVLALTVMTAAVFVLMWGLFRLLNAQESEKEPDPGPMAMKDIERLPPDPKLQAARGFGVKLENGQWVPLENREPEAEYVVLRDQWERRLNCQGATEAEKLTNCVSIESAMDNIVSGGALKSSFTTAGKGPNKAPTAWSSGRQ